MTPPGCTTALLRDAPDEAVDAARPLPGMPAPRDGSGADTARDSGRTRHVLVLFGSDWDDELLHRYAATGRWRFSTEGFDLFRFPSNAQLLWVNIERFVDKMVRRYRGRIDGVISTNEQFGALAAALVAERLGLPGTPPAHILLAQHKLAARDALRHRFAHLQPPWYLAAPYDIPPAQAERFAYPLFVKPLKATFSVLAREVHSAQELRAHLRFRPWEKHIIKRLLVPYNQALRKLRTHVLDAHHVILESPMRGLQVNVDGYAWGGERRILGIADEVMYPGTMSFLRFEAPSRLPADWQARIERTALAVMAELGYTHGFFNLEFFVDPDSGALKLIEVNPRLAAQLAEFHQWLHGIDVYELGFEMACNAAPPAPASPPARGRYGAAASFVWRAFDAQSCPRLPSAADLAWLRSNFAHARLKCFPKSGHALRRDLKWLSSHRWALLNMPAADAAALRAGYEAICARLGWPAPY
ncbi:MAG: ATP-grasp domain-containing protein [Betaproteobacteria bacterium]|nr:ATP-grasp domain-containing protein [Betaproteobacteria bacterium]